MADDLVPGAAFFTHPRPRVLCEDCGRRVTYGTLLDLAGRVPGDVLREFASFVPVGGLVYWCSCGLVGAFSEPFRE
jgi:hypothetical protein